MIIVQLASTIYVITYAVYMLYWLTAVMIVQSARPKSVIAYAMYL